MRNPVVAMSATETTYANDQVQSFDPFKKTGIIEEAMVTCILPYVKTAREAIARFAKIIKGHTAGESDGILFVDPKEAWYFEIGTAHKQLSSRKIKPLSRRRNFPNRKKQKIRNSWKNKGYKTKNRSYLRC